MGFFTLIAELTLNASKFHSGLRGAQTASQSFGQRLQRDVQGKLAAAFSTTAILAATKRVIDFGSQINDTAKRLNISTGALQEFNYAAQQSGATMSDIERAFKALSKARDDALSGDQELSQVFGLFGIDSAALKANSLEQTFKQIASTIQSTDFGASEIDLVVKLLGRGADTLLPAFKEGFVDAANEARRLGIVIDDEVISGLDEAGDAVTRLNSRFRTVLAPSVIFIADRIRDIVDFLDIAVGGTGALIGGFLGSEGNIIERYKAGSREALEHMKNVLDARIAAENPAQAKERAKRDPGDILKALTTGKVGGGSGEVSPFKAAPTRSSDALLSVGNFLGSQPGHGLDREVVDIKRLLQDIKRNTDPFHRQGVGFPNL